MRASSRPQMLSLRSQIHVWANWLAQATIDVATLACARMGATVDASKTPATRAIERRRMFMASRGKKLGVERGVNDRGRLPHCASVLRTPRDREQCARDQLAAPRAGLG